MKDKSFAPPNMYAHKVRGWELKVTNRIQKVLIIAICIFLSVFGFIYQIKQMQDNKKTVQSEISTEFKESSNDKR